MTAPFTSLLLRWYRRHGRDLPWRRTCDPYAILVSEVMLQQTQVVRVIPKYGEFLKRFPNWSVLAAAELRDVLRIWSGLGYNSRARRLWECARAVLARYGGRLPNNVEGLRSLPGLGRYTAAALAVFAFGAREAAVDTNVRRVLSRALLGSEPSSTAAIWTTARELVPTRAGTWHHALMDVGALFCRATPACEICPLQRGCRWAALSPAQRCRRMDLKNAVRGSRGSSGLVNSTAPYKGSRREHRGRLIRVLAGARSVRVRDLGPQVKDGFRATDLPWLLGLLEDLQRDGLVAFDRKRNLARIA